MANIPFKEWNFDNKFDTLMMLIPMSMLGRKKNVNFEDSVLPLAALLFLRAYDCLYLIDTVDVNEKEDQVIVRYKNVKEKTDECVCYNKKWVAELDDVLFRDLLTETIETYSKKVKDASCVVIFTLPLLLQVFKEGELLALLDRAVKEVYHFKLESSQPHELSLLVSHLVDKKAKYILDPFGGFMDFATTMPDKVFSAYETDEMAVKFARFRIALANLKYYAAFRHSSWENWELDVFNAIVTFPPFASKVVMNDDLSEGIPTDVDQAVLSRFEYCTDVKHGQLVMVVPLSTLFRENSGMKDLRRTLTEKNLLDTVVILPSNILQTTKIPTAIIVLKKGKRKNDKVRFIDASDCFFKKEEVNILDVETIIHRYNECDFFVSKETIIECDSLWDFRWYMEQNKNIFNERYLKCKVKDVLTILPTQNIYNETKGRLVGVKELSNSVYNYEKKTDDFPISDVTSIVSKITEPVILLSLINTPKPTYCEASEENPIFIKNDVCACRVTNKTIHMGYLCLELDNRLKAFNGSVIPGLTKGQILNTIIGFPSLDDQRSIIEQKNIFDESVRIAQMAKAKELGLEALLEQKKKEYVEEIRHRKHDMKTPMAQLRNTLTLLESLVPLIAGEPSEKLMLYVNRQKKALDMLSEIVTHIADEDNFAKPEPINLGEVLSSFKTKTNRYIIDYYIDNTAFSESGIEKPIVMMGKSDLLRLVQNIVENAIKRGFTGDYPEYALNISLTIKDGFYFIDFSNNGEPLPEGLTKERYGMKGEKGKGSDGSGTGGYIVKSITEHYGGDYDIFTHHFAEQYFTHVIVKLPIYQVEDE